MPTNKNETDIAVLQSEMSDVRADIREMKTAIIESAARNETALEKAVTALRDIFTDHDAKCYEDKKHEAQFRRETYRATEKLRSDFDKFRLEQQVKFDLKRDWFKIVMSLAAFLVSLGGLYIAFKG